MSKTAGASQTIHYRNYRRARDRAMARLTKAYPDQYKQYLQEERALDETTGKKWVSTGATVSVGLSLESHEHSSKAGDSSADEGTNQGNDGGEA